MNLKIVEKKENQNNSTKKVEPSFAKSEASDSIKYTTSRNVNGTVVKETTMKENPKKDEKITKKDVLSFILTIAIACAVAFLLTKFVFCRTIVEGNSMQSTLNNNDNLIVEMVSYYFRNPTRYEIVTLHPYSKDEKSFIKRVVGLPGETVQIVDGRLTINGELMEDDIYGEEIMYGVGYDSEGKRNLLNTDPVTLGENEFYVLGDNRNHSNDSRYLGPIPKNKIYGRAVFRFYPFDQMTSFKVGE